MKLRITLIHQGSASLKDIATDPKGNVSVRSLLLQCGVTRTKNELVWVRRDGAKKFRSKPLGDFSHLLKQHHENATIVISPLMPKASIQLPLSLPSPGPHSTPAQNPETGPPTPTTPSPTTRDRRPSRAAERRKSARDNIRRQMRQRRNAADTGPQGNTSGSQLISMQRADSSVHQRFYRKPPIRRLS